MKPWRLLFLTALAWLAALPAQALVEDTAYAATLTAVLLVLLALLAVVQFLLIEKRVHYR